MAKSKHYSGRTLTLSAESFTSEGPTCEERSVSRNIQKGGAGIKSPYRRNSGRYFVSSAELRLASSSVGPRPRFREGRPLLEYGRYLLALKSYLKEVGLKDLATHNLRHSTSGLWMAHGASDQDMRLLFAHSDDKVTQRYIHFQTARQLGKVANVIRIFPEREVVDCNDSSQNLPKSGLEKVDVTEGV